MILTNSILEDIRLAVGLSATSPDFDTDLLMYINASIGTLKQNGIGSNIVVTDANSTWGDLQDPEQSDYNEYFKMVPLFIMLSTKLLFDPPPPSSVQYHQSAIDQTLWRLRASYEQPLTTINTTTNEDW